MKKVQQVLLQAFWGSVDHAAGQYVAVLHMVTLVFSVYWFTFRSFLWFFPEVSQKMETVAASLMTVSILALLSGFAFNRQPESQQKLRRVVVQAVDGTFPPGEYNMAGFSLLPLVMVAITSPLWISSGWWKSGSVGTVASVALLFFAFKRGYRRQQAGA